MKLVPLLCLPLLVSAAAPQDTGTSAAASPVDEWNRADVASVVDFLVAKEDSWLQSLPRGLQWREWAPFTTGSIHWTGLLDDGRLSASFEKFPAGVTEAQRSLDLAVHRGEIRYDGQRWMNVERPIPDEIGRAWQAIVSSSCPSKKWDRSLLNRALNPLYGMSVHDFRSRYPEISHRSTDELVEVRFCASDDVRTLLLDDAWDQVSGLIGFQVQFAKEAGWRPVRIAQICAVENFDGTESFPDVERFLYEEATCAEVRVQRWIDWSDTLGVALPGGLDDLIFRNLETKPHAELEYRTSGTLSFQLGDTPSNEAFELTPPEWVGPLGKVKDQDSGGVQVYDSRRVEDKTRAKASFVEMVASVTENDQRAAASTPTPRWVGYVALLASAFFALLTGVRSLRQRRVVR